MKGDNETTSTIGIKLRNIVTYIEKKYIDFSKKPVNDNWVYF